MATDPRVGRQFTYTSVLEYYTWKCSQQGPTENIEFPDIKFASYDELSAHLENVASERQIPFTACHNTWNDMIDTMDKSNQIKIWKYREYLLCQTLLFVGHLIQQKPASIQVSGYPIREVPQSIDILQNFFSVVGSSNLTSDIDIMIQGRNAYVIVAVIEDIFEYFNDQKSIPVKCWDIEFYRDSRILSSLYINTKRFNPGYHQEMLMYAFVSYFRSLHIIEGDVPIISPFAKTLGDIYLFNLQDSRPLEEVVDSAFNFWIKTAPHGRLDREKFYKDSKVIEDVSEQIQPYLVNKSGVVVSNNTELSIKGFIPVQVAATLFFKTAHGDVHRPESYVLPSTVVHIVKMEQSREGKNVINPIPDSWFSTDARMGIDFFGYLASCIEQLGYLEHYHPEGTTCSKKGSKYFGRLIRGLVKTGLINENNRAVAISQELDRFRSNPNTEQTCNKNIYALLATLNNELNEKKWQAVNVKHQRKTRKTRKSRKYRKTPNKRRRRNLSN